MRMELIEAKGSETIQVVRRSIAARSSLLVVLVGWSVVVRMVLPLEDVALARCECGTPELADDDFGFECAAWSRRCTASDDADASCGCFRILG